MKKLLILGVLLFSCAAVSGAEEGGSGSVYYSLGPINLNIPFAKLSTVALYDMIGKSSLVGAETPILSIWKMTGDVGAVISPEGKGTPFLGGHLELGTPLDRFVALADVHFGGFGGYNINEHRAIAGVKASIALW